MATFTVDPATLETLCSTLSSIHSEMDGMTGVVNGYQGLLGGSDLEGTLESACNHWGYGVKQLSKDMTDVVQRLQAAAQTYGQSEDAIQAACGRPK